MNEIEKLIKIGEDYYKSLCPLKDIEDHSSCKCKKMGNIWAFREHFIPEQYRNYTLSNFDGRNRVSKNKENILSLNVVLKARKSFACYCYRDTEDLDDYDEIKWIEKSIMDERRSYGHNLVIYGNPHRVVSLPPSSSSSGKQEIKFIRKPIGKTMLACLALREAINLRWRPGHSGDSYCFVKYNDLIHHLLSNADGNKSFEDKINLYSTCDWLVVDEIGRGSSLKESDATKRFKASVLNSLFSERIANNLPNILVFEDDLSKILNDLDYEFGSSLTDIIRNKKTHKIALVEDEK